MLIVIIGSVIKGVNHERKSCRELQDHFHRLLNLYMQDNPEAGTDVTVLDLMTWLSVNTRYDITLPRGGTITG